MIDALQNYLAAALILVGSTFSLTASVGLLRLPDLYTRMHAASKAGTLGSCVVLLALAVHADDPAISLRALAGIVFFLLTVPISSHLLAKAAHRAGYALWEHSERDELQTALEQEASSASVADLRNSSQP
ncbi:monovalent cation/H(+) antiporter subunit G [Mesorhizobium sp. KR9-304]|uniref:monovalent cation/H(+) antiporter subunit G n=1 Tax=Mesorhizobium sp. KR9-304 TaxID=3156614 RepID=UPI0032B44761